MSDFTATSFDDSLQIDNPYPPWVVGAKYTYEAEIGIRGTTARKSLEIRGGDADVYFSQSKVVRNAVVRLGSGDNRLSISESTIDRLVADGGNGTNVLDDLGDNTIRMRSVSRFGV